jgi:hypothetical protein
MISTVYKKTSMQNSPLYGIPTINTLDFLFTCIRLVAVAGPLPFRIDRIIDEFDRLHPQDTSVVALGRVRKLGCSLREYILESCLGCDTSRDLMVE